MDGKAMKVLIITALCWVFVAETYARDSPPSISSPQGNTWPKPVEYVKVPDSSTFPCSAKAKPDAMYYWTFNGTRIKNSNEVSFNEFTGTLTTGSKFGQDNSGDYQCFAYNSKGTAMTPILRILAGMHKAFYGKETTDVITAYDSNYLKLPCKDANESVPWWTFSWDMKKPNSAFQEVKQDKRHIIDDEGNLHFLWVDPSDAGSYVCLVENSVFHVTYRSINIIDLRVVDAEKNDRGPDLVYSKDIQAYAKQKAGLMCIFSYYSTNKDQLQVKWTIQGVEVGRGPNITLENLKFSDEGEYVCEATVGTITNDRTKVNLKVVSPPTFIPGRELQTKSVPVEKDAVFHCGTTSYKTYSHPPVWFVNGEPLIGCPERQYECWKTMDNGYSRCIDRVQNGVGVICDTLPGHCPDKSDDFNCTALNCLESQKQCWDTCVLESAQCDDSCPYENFRCHDGYRCVSAEKLCNGQYDCNDGSDELACPDGKDIKRNRFYINSQRTELTLPSVSLSDSMCFQCMVRNEYGSTFGDGCLKVIDKIVIIKGPNSTYNVEPDTRIEIIMEAITDVDWQNQMNYTWYWYDEVEDKKTGKMAKVSVSLPPKGSNAFKSFTLKDKGRNMTIVFPAVKEDDDKNFDIYNKLINRNYTVIVQHEYDKVELNFTVNGKQIVKPAPIVEAASTNLWFIALILGILLLFIVVALIICYMYRNRGGTYPLDKKEHQAGYDPEQELKDGGLHDVGRIDDGDNPPDDKASLTESVKPYESDDDPTADYDGDFDASKFNEEGSFIGVYGDRSKEATV